MEQAILEGLIIIDNHDLYLKQPDGYRINLLSKIEELCHNYGHEATIQYEFDYKPIAIYSVIYYKLSNIISGAIYVSRTKVKYPNYETDYEYTLMIEGKDLYEEFTQKQGSSLYLVLFFNN
jgi:hypothetical protein